MELGAKRRKVSQHGRTERKTLPKRHAPARAAERKFAETRATAVRVSTSTPDRSRPARPTFATGARRRSISTCIEISGTEVTLASASEYILETGGSEPIPSS